MSDDLGPQTLAVDRRGGVKPRLDSSIKIPLQRGKGARERLLTAARKLLCAKGYLSVSVDEIAAAADVSRMTFYRHFRDKAEIAAELFQQAAEAAIPRFLVIGTRHFQDPKIVSAWIEDLFAADRASRNLLRVFTQASANEAGFTKRAHGFIGELIAGLGRAVPAFAADPNKPDERRRWLEAWLLIYELLDQSNHAALKSGISTDPLVIEILAERFLAFVDTKRRSPRA